MRNRILKNIAIAALTTFWFTTSFAQSFIGIVIDLEDYKPIPYAEIYFVDLKSGTISDENGMFTIDNFGQKNNHIQISCLGYNTIDLIVDLATTQENKFFLARGHYKLKEVIVSVPDGKLQGENIVIVEHKKLKQLEQIAPVSLSETITNIPGVEQNSTGVGISKPIIRGLSGNRIVTYAQGIRIENQQWGSEHGLGVGGVGIEGVEVIKGPASLLYGSDALGGVSYFIDERYTNKNSIEGFAQTKYFSNTLGTINDAGIKIHAGKIKLNVFGKYTSHADYQVPGLNRVFNTRFDEKNIKSSLGFNTKNWISNIRYSYLQNNFGIVEDVVYLSARKRNFILPFQAIDNHNISFENTFYMDQSKINLTLGHSSNYRKEYEDDREAQAIGLKLNTSTYNLKWYSPVYNDLLSLVVGSQGMVQVNENDGEEILIPDGETVDFGAFAIANLYFKNLRIKGGIRADHRNIETKQMETDDRSFAAIKNKYSGFTYSVGANYQFTKASVRANVSSGFRAPTTAELLSDGVHEGTNRYEVGNTNLKNENAIQIDFSYDYENEHISFSVNPFYNSIQNYIFLSPTELIVDNNPVFEYLQTNAFLYGGEIGFHLHPHKVHWLHLETNFSTVIAEDENKNALPLIPQTKLNSTIGAEIGQEGKVRLNRVFVQHIYKFNQNRIGLFELATNDYHLMNMGLNFEIATQNHPIEINTGIKNVFNTSYIDHLSRFRRLEIPNQGINFYLGLKVKFGKNIEKAD